MLENIRQFSLLNRLFDVKDNEWSRLLIAWFAKFFYRIVFVVNWTLVVTIFVSNMGIHNLPYLFVINAFFTILGSVFYSTFLHYFKRTSLMAYTIIGAGALFLFAGLLFNFSHLLFFAILVVTESICLVQLKMLLDAFTEDLFTPLSGERVFPLVEAAETTGGVLAGILVFSLASSMPVSNFAYLSVVLIFLIMPLLAYYSYFLKTKKYIHEKHKKHEKSSPGIFDKLKTEFSNKTQFGFIKGMAAIVFIQWMLFNLMEFQYTKAVYNEVSSVIMESGSGFEHAFIHDLGVLFTLFSVSALIIQLFLGGKIIKSLGVVGSMILHPIVTLLSLVGMLLNFNFLTAVLAKNNFTATTIIYTNAYHASYYALKEDIREYIREFLDGFIRPLGALLGTSGLLLIQFLAKESGHIFFVNIFIVCSAFVLLYLAYKQQNKYTAISMHGLMNKKNKEERFIAIDILAQNGHKNTSQQLANILADEDEELSVRIKILKAFEESQEPEAIPGIIKCLNSQNHILQEKLISTLLSYKDLRSIVSGNLLLKYELLNSLKKIYIAEKSPLIKSGVMFLLSKVSATSAVEFLLNVLKNPADEKYKPDAIYALGNYKDLSINNLLKSFLESKNIKQQINAAISIGRTKEFFDEACYLISSFLYSGKLDKIEYGLFAVGELKLKKENPVCFRYLDSKNINLRMQSAVALLKMNCREAIPVIIELKLRKDVSVREKLKYLMRNIDPRFLKNIDKIVIQIIDKKVEEMFLEVDSVENLDKKTLLNLKCLYNIIEEYEDVVVINKLLTKKI